LLPEIHDRIFADQRANRDLHAQLPESDVRKLELISLDTHQHNRVIGQRPAGTFRFLTSDGSGGVTTGRW